MLKRIPFLSLLDRYIMAQLVPPFVFGLGIFTSLGLTIGVRFDVMRKLVADEISWAIAGQILLLRLPEYLVLGLPMAVLLGSLAAYSSLSTFSEIIALRSAGLKPIRLMVPCILGGLLVTGVTFWVNDWVVPQTANQAATVMSLALGDDDRDFQDKNIIYPEYQRIKDDQGDRREVLKTLFYAERFNGEAMENLTILDRAKAQSSRIITAEKARWDEVQQNWRMSHGMIYQIDTTGSFKNIREFDTEPLEVSEAPLTLATQCQRLSNIRLHVIDVCLDSLKLSRNEKKIRTLQVKKQEKFAVPFICVVFAIVGAAIGLRPQNSSRATSVGLSVIIVFSYYLISVISTSMGVWGTLTPMMGTWLPNVLGLGAAAFIVWRTG
jgi:lipopolysaccharide export system permease protein